MFLCSRIPTQCVEGKRVAKSEGIVETNSRRTSFFWERSQKSKDLPLADLNVLESGVQRRRFQNAYKA
ncbi:hypothetical protein TELCIR_03990 [Teladorsagia circumcincta]|uniref:Uncharacterized protein n=1 Tax=Teladorsagia circumcincta TaxID=45464 RepID=A0A2G9UUU0_TELCI|nr:hypothetical protein TELCIR_03990 [Teladorsagia circumcincta]